MKRLYAISGFMLLLALASQAHAQDRRQFTGPSACNCGNGTGGRTVVLIVDNSTGLTEISNRLDNGYIDSTCPKPILKTIPWASGDSTTRDYRDRLAQMAGAARLVTEAKLIRKYSPNQPIVIIAFSEGAYVALLAAQQMPPGYIERIILLSPAVSSCFDIRPAIASAKLGMDVFYASDDSVVEFYENQFGSPDGVRGSMAGTTGFLLNRGPWGKDPIFCNLRQTDVTLFGTTGGHQSTVTSYALQRRVIPLIPLAPIAAIIPQTGPPPGAPLPPGGPFPPPGGPIPPPGYVPPPPPMGGPVPPPMGGPIPPPMGGPIPPVPGASVPPPGPVPPPPPAVNRLAPNGPAPGDPAIPPGPPSPPNGGAGSLPPPPTASLPPFLPPPAN